MSLFEYRRAENLADLSMARSGGVHVIAGGTDLLQLVEEQVLRPEAVLDINELPLGGIASQAEGLRIGALSRLAQIADHSEVKADFTAAAQALAATASGQVRNMATAGGNLLQRTRCLYFRDVTTPCNKREPGSGCSALEGRNRLNAIFGGSEQCIAVQPSDFAVALLALDAEVEIIGPGGERRVPIEQFHREPGETPHIETVLEPGELIAALWLPRTNRRSHYYKVRHRASFEWALVSCALSLRLAEDGQVEAARVAVGGVGTRPWRLPRVEAVLIGRALDQASIQEAADLSTEGAQPRGEAAAKIPVLRAAVARALTVFGTEETVG